MKKIYLSIFLMLLNPHLNAMDSESYEIIPLQKEQSDNDSDCDDKQKFTCYNLCSKLYDWIFCAKHNHKQGEEEVATNID